MTKTQEAAEKIHDWCFHSDTWDEPTKERIESILAEYVKPLLEANDRTARSVHTRHAYQHPEFDTCQDPRCVFARKLSEAYGGGG